MRVEDLTHATLVEWGDPVPADIPVVGAALRGADGQLQCVLAVLDMSGADMTAYPADDVRAVRFREAPGWWAAMDSRGPVSPLAHRYGLKIKSGLRQAGVQEVFADPDPAISRSEQWLERLGFGPWRMGIWRCDLVVGGQCSRGTVRGGAIGSDRTPA